MIHVIIGTKAQLVKMGPVLSLMQKKKIFYNFILTGQHRETISDLRENFDIKDPDFMLYDGKDITSIGKMLWWMIKILHKSIINKNRLFRGDRNGIVLVHGDTFSCLLGALLGKINGHRVAHVESGLRSFNLFHPFPEEIIRLLTFCLTDIYFCPGGWAVDNLKQFKGLKIDTRHNTLFDSLVFALGKLQSIDIEIPSDPYCVISTHRFENIFNREMLKRIVETIKMISKNKRVLFILHPPTVNKLKEFGLMEELNESPFIELRPRYDYFSFIKLVYCSDFLVTDGGSNQEEAFYIGHPCLLLRKTTEREEGLGKNVVISGYDMGIIKNFIVHHEKYRKGPLSLDLSPSKIIINTLMNCQA